MMHGRNNGKKLMTVRIVKHAFEIIHLLTGEVGFVARLCPGYLPKPHSMHARSSCSELRIGEEHLGPDIRLIAPFSHRTLYRSW
jgi:hypothetical protein